MSRTEALSSRDTNRHLLANKRISVRSQSFAEVRTVAHSEGNKASCDAVFTDAINILAYLSNQVKRNITLKITLMNQMN